MPPLTLEQLKAAARDFTRELGATGVSELYGVTDGKAVGTHVEHAFHEYLTRRFSYAPRVPIRRGRLRLPDRGDYDTEAGFVVVELEDGGEVWVSADWEGCWVWVQVGTLPRCLPKSAERHKLKGDT